MRKILLSVLVNLIMLGSVISQQNKYFINTEYLVSITPDNKCGDSILIEGVPYVAKVDGKFMIGKLDLHPIDYSLISKNGNTTTYKIKEWFLEQKSARYLFPDSSWDNSNCELLLHETGDTLELEIKPLSLKRARKIVFVNINEELLAITAKFPTLPNYCFQGNYIYSGCKDTVLVSKGKIEGCGFVNYRLTPQDIFYKKGDIYRKSSYIICILEKTSGIKEYVLAYRNKRYLFFELKKDKNNLYMGDLNFELIPVK